MIGATSGLLSQAANLPATRKTFEAEMKPLRKMSLFHDARKGFCATAQVIRAWDAARFSHSAPLFDLFRVSLVPWYPYTLSYKQVFATYSHSLH